MLYYITTSLFQYYCHSKEPLVASETQKIEPFTTLIHVYIYETYTSNTLYAHLVERNLGRISLERRSSSNVKPCFILRECGESVEEGEGEGDPAAVVME